jgi:DNA-binding MarR family transcriptional regulator
MADVNFARPVAVAPAATAEKGDSRSIQGLDLELIELIFFAYRDFVGEADHVLEVFGFGRAHHRVVYFVSRHPGLRVSDLLDILQITKQSLSRVLKQLVDDGYIEQKAGPVDRRERLLYASDKGQRLADELSARQDARIRKALTGMPATARATVRDFLYNMVDTPPRVPGGEG